MGYNKNDTTITIKIKLSSGFNEGGVKMEDENLCILDTDAEPDPYEIWVNVDISNPSEDDTTLMFESIM